MTTKILIVEDDLDLAKLVASRLRRRDFEVLTAGGGQEALRLAYQADPDLIILDIMMPDMDGWQVCQRVRELSDVPIIMLTAKSAPEDIVRGFQLGVDDFVSKPFSLEVLELRIRAIMKRARRGRSKTPEVYDDGCLRIDLERQHVFREGQLVDLTPTEFRLLRCLVLRVGSVVSHQELLREAWGEGYADATDNLSLYIHYLRDKLEKNPRQPRYIRTQWGRGYWLASADEGQATSPGS